MVMIHPASLEDEKDLRTLCTAVYEDDYVLHHLSAWLKKGGIYVYEQEHQIKGMIRLTYSRDGQAHLGAIRVHPDCRRQGIGTALTTYCIDICRTHKVRLAIMDTMPSQALAEKLGFSHVATFTYLLRSGSIIEKRERSYQAVAQSRIVNPASALTLLKHSPLYLQNHSLLSSSFTFYTPSVQSLESLLLIARKNRLAAIDFQIEEALKRAVQIAYTDSDSALLEAVLHQAAQRRAEEIWAVIPKDEELITLLALYNFEPVKWGKTINVFELHVTCDPTRTGC